MGELEMEIAELIGKHLARTGKLLTIGTAELAASGRIADKLTNTPDSSDYFKDCIVALQ